MCKDYCQDIIAFQPKAVGRELILLRSLSNNICESCTNPNEPKNSYKEHYLSKISHQPEASVVHFISSVRNNDLISTAS